MISAQTARPRSIWQQLGGSAGDDWRSLVYAVGDTMDERSAPLHAVRDLEAAVARVAARHADLGGELHDRVNEAKTAIYDAALVLGVALARTWPDRLEDLDRWPDRALALAELEAERPSSTPHVQPAAARTPATPADLAQGRPPFVGETIAHVLERSGSVPERPYDWLDLVLQTLWEESPQRDEYRIADHQVIDLMEHGAPVSAEVLGRFDNVRIDEVCDATHYAGRLGYALGKYEHLPEAERIARARAFANLIMRRSGDAPLDPAEWEALRRGRRAAAPATADQAAGAAATRDADAVDAWLTEHALTAAAPAEAIARLLADPGALERLRPTPTPA